MLVYEYKIAIEKKMIIRAVRTNQLYFLYCVFAYNKNYEYMPLIEDDDSKSGSGSEENDQFGINSKDAEVKDQAMRCDHANYFVFTFEFLIEKIITFCDEFAE
jgi:hypothetical protein